MIFLVKKTRMYQNQKRVNSCSSGTIWGGAFLARRGFRITNYTVTPAVVPVEITSPEIPIVSSAVVAPLQNQFNNEADELLFPAETQYQVDNANSVIEPFQIAEAMQISDELYVEPSVAEPVSLTQDIQQDSVSPPPLIPATPVPYDSNEVNGFQTEWNAEGARVVNINNSRVTIPDLDIIAVIPDE